ncbi:hypothetical protein DSECCO2_634310 [anaerobic digester metagenome]
MTATFIDHFALRVHHVVVFQQTFTNSEVVFLHFLLGALHRFVQHIVLKHITFLEAHPIHKPGNPFGGKQAHQVIFKRHEKDR